MVQVWRITGRFGLTRTTHHGLSGERVDDRLGLELGGLRGEVSMLREGAGPDRRPPRCAPSRRRAGEPAQRRFTIGAIIGAAGFVLSALGVIVQLLLAA